MGCGYPQAGAYEKWSRTLPELAGPPEPPARLHGDLWSGNVMHDTAGGPVLIDPAAYGALLDGAHYVETTYPSRICYEACGIVDAVGEDVSDFTIGDRVSAVPFGNPDYCVGGEWAITPAAFLAPWPEDFSAAEGAATWMQYMTGYFPLVEGARVRPGDNVLITAASSSAGVACPFTGHSGLPACCEGQDDQQDAPDRAEARDRRGAPGRACSTTVPMKTIH